MARLSLTSRGQVKPPGIPRINWRHPLAKGLLFYGFDTGGGLIVDLVAGRPMTKVGTWPANGVSPWGAGIKWQGSGGAYFNADAAIRNATAAGNYTYACAYLQTGTVGSFAAPFVRTANNNGSSPFNNWTFAIDPSGAGQADVQGSYCISTGFNNTANWTGNANQVFTSLVGTATTALSLYAQGGLVALSSAGTAANNSTQDSIGFSTSSAAAVVNPFIGFVFYGAFWSRPLSPSEILALHEQPYDFLEWPTDLGTNPSIIRQARQYGPVIPPKTKKPTGVPIINLDHPLAEGLLFYAYDTGLGAGPGGIIDLVGQRPAKIIGTPPAVAPSPWGQGLLWNGQSSAVFQQDAAIQAATATGRYTYACGCVQTADVGAYTRMFCRTALNAGGGPYANWSFDVNPGNTGQQFIFWEVSTVGGVDSNIALPYAAQQRFMSLGGVATGSSLLCYVNGMKVGSLTGLTFADVDNLANIIISGQADSGATSPWTGFVFYGAFWGRPLTPEQLLLLHDDPWCMLIVPGAPQIPSTTTLAKNVLHDERPPFESGFTQPGPLIPIEFASTPGAHPVQGDSYPLLEFLSGAPHTAAVRNDSWSPIEFRALTRVDPLPLLEAGGSQIIDQWLWLETSAYRRLPPAQLEYGITARGDAAGDTESGATDRSDAQAAAEMAASNLRTDALPPLESLAGHISDRPLLIEPGLVARLDGPTPIEPGLVARLDAQSLAELIASQRVDPSMPAEIGGSPQLTLAVFFPTEGLISVRADPATAQEFAGGIGISLLRDTLAAIEALATGRADPNAAIEVLLSARADPPALAELLGTSRADAQIVAEVLAGLLHFRPPPIEAAAVYRLDLFPLLESLVTQRVDPSPPLEELLNVLMRPFPAIETSALGAMSDRFAGLETGVLLRVDPTWPSEFGTSLIVDPRLALELATSLARDQIPIEFLGAAARGAAANAFLFAEWLGTFVADPRAAAEFAALSASDRNVALELFRKLAIDLYPLLESLETTPPALIKIGAGRLLKSPGKVRILLRDGRSWPH